MIIGRKEEGQKSAKIDDVTYGRPSTVNQQVTSRGTTSFVNDFMYMYCICLINLVIMHCFCTMGKRLDNLW